MKKIQAYTRINKREIENYPEIETQINYELLRKFAEEMQKNNVLELKKRVSRKETNLNIK